MRASSGLGCLAGSSVSDTASVDRKPWTIFWIFLAVGVFFTLANLRWPIARNALCYAKAALGVIQYHFNLCAIAHDRVWTSGKPIFFSGFAALFVRFFGANVGMIIASAIGTSFFLWTVALALPRLNRLSGLEPNLTTLQFVLVAFNPLVIYQFWSGYPDSLFAGLVILAFVLTDVIATDLERDTRWHIFRLGVTIYVAIHTKLYGAVLLLACPLYLLVYVRKLLMYRRSSYFGILASMFMLLVVVLVTAKLNLNPLLDFAEGGGAADYVRGIANVKLRDVFDSLWMLGFAALLIFQASLLFLATRAAWRAWAAAPSLFFGTYLLGLLTFRGTAYNMRYFLPMFPFFATVLVAGARSIKPAARQTILAAYAIIALFLVLSFNLASISLMVQPLRSKLSARFVRLDAWLDNLRLPVHMALKKQIDTINANVPEGKELYWSSDYYGTATRGLARHLGVKRGLEIRYVLEPSEIRPPPGPVFLTAFSSTAPTDKLWQIPEWATLRAFGYGLFRLDPISVELAPLPAGYVKGMNPIRLRANVTVGDHLKIRSLEFREGDTVLGSSRQQPFEVTWRAPKPGRHEIITRVTYGQEDALASESVIYVGIPALERTAKTRTDLAFEMPDGFVWPLDETLMMTGEESAIGIRFEKLNVAQKAHIANSYLALTAAHPASLPTTFEVQGELAADAAALKFEKGDLSRRRRAVARVNWVAKPWTQAGEQERSPNLAPILEEVFAQPGWQPGNAVLLFIRCSGRRIVQLADANGRGAPPVLYIELQLK